MSNCLSIIQDVCQRINLPNPTTAAQSSDPAIQQVVALDLCELLSGFGSITLRLLDLGQLSVVSLLGLESPVLGLLVGFRQSSANAGSFLGGNRPVSLRFSALRFLGHFGVFVRSFRLGGGSSVSHHGLLI